MIKESFIKENLTKGNLTKETLMRRNPLLVLGALALVGAFSTEAAALVAGGGSKKSDCYAEWQVNSPEVGPNKGKTGINCVDGDASCDADGTVNCTCTFNVGICVNQTDVPGCTPQPLTDITNITSPVTKPTDLATANCGSSSEVRVQLVEKKNGKLKKAKKKLSMTALSSGKPKSDKDKLQLTCNPAAGATADTCDGTIVTECPANPNGGPKELKLTTVLGGVGGDLDNGWNGGSHNFPIVGSSVLDFCLTGCDAAGSTPCTGTGPTGAGTKNTEFFGAPLPLKAATTVCVVNRFNGNITLNSADLQTGAIEAAVVLFSDVYLTPANEICPQCSGATIGATGTCRGGKNNGKPCTTQGTTRVAEAPAADKDFELSADCPPAGTPAATLDINLVPFTTGTATLAGSKPCPGQPSDDGCTGGGSCTGECSAQANLRGGVAQVCCSNNSNLPCFPSGDAGSIERQGSFTALTPAGSFPATSNVTFASVFCEPPTGESVIDTVAAGLPGPGALLQPMTADWLP
jgi:hypothetical protein